ncbi:TetR/AcrR family transcriptional regulator [Streptomyces sp. NPDC048604]|uniref:TetR/AcrR family transcriptional regulator n=1 Tax=Streptomyces sp. NPDC048604 TaxID=3365578 RepID=UPI00371912D5
MTQVAQAVQAAPAPSAKDRRTAILGAAARVIARRGVRGLRVTELAEEAGVSTGLIYYHFKDRTGVLRHTLEHINDRAERYTTAQQADAAPLTPREELDQVLLLELQDTAEVRENSTVWGELRAGAVFEPDLREELVRAGAAWVREIADLLAPIAPAAPEAARVAAAERLTVLLEGLSVRWLIGTLPAGHATALMREAIAAEVAALCSQPSHLTEISVSVTVASTATPTHARSAPST